MMITCVKCLRSSRIDRYVAVGHRSGWGRRATMCCFGACTVFFFFLFFFFWWKGVCEHPANPANYAPDVEDESLIFCVLVPEPHRDGDARVRSFPCALVEMKRLSRSSFWCDYRRKFATCFAVSSLLLSWALVERVWCIPRNDRGSESFKLEKR